MPLQTNFDKKAFGSRLKQARTACHLRVSEVTDRTNVTENSIRDYENGDVLPRLDYIALIAKSLNVSLDWLVLGRAQDTTTK